MGESKRGDRLYGQGVIVESRARIGERSKRMARNIEATVRDLKPYADKHGFKAVIAVCIMDDGQFAVNSFGQNVRFCKAAGTVCDRLFEELSSGEIEIPEDLL